jgi:hypothetical protein
MRRMKISNIRKGLSINLPIGRCYSHTMWQKDAKIIKALVWVPAASPGFELPEHAVAFRVQGSFYELTSKIDLSITADSILTNMFIVKLETEHNTTSCLHKLRKKPPYEALCSSPEWPSNKLWCLYTKLLAQKSRPFLIQSIHVHHK